MASAYLLARAMGRQRSALPAIGLAAGLMVAVDPAILRSVSFQLSFAAVAGIALLATPIHDLFHHGIEKATGTESRSNAVLKSRWSQWSPCRSLRRSRPRRWSPSTSAASPPGVFRPRHSCCRSCHLTVVLGALTGLAGLVSEQLGVVFGWPLWVAGSYMSGVSDLFANLGPDLFESAAWSSPAAIAYYVCVTAFLARKRIRSAIVSLREQLVEFSIRPSGGLPAPPLWLAVAAGPLSPPPDSRWLSRLRRQTCCGLRSSKSTAAT